MSYETLPHLKKTQTEQFFINKYMRLYHRKGSARDTHCILNKLNFSKGESELHIARKLVLALNFKFFISEAARTNVAMDYEKKYPYRNSNGMELIRDLVDLGRNPGAIHEIETRIGHGSAETYKRFLYGRPWIPRGDSKKGWVANTKHIRDPDWNNLFVSLYDKDKEIWTLNKIINKSNTKKYFSNYELEFQPIDKYCGIAVKDFDTIAGKRIVDEKIKFEESRTIKIIKKYILK